MTVRDKVYVIDWRGLRVRPVGKVTTARVYFSDSDHPRFVESFDGWAIRGVGRAIYAWTLTDARAGVEREAKSRMDAAEREIAQASEDRDWRLAKIDAAEAAGKDGPQ